MVVYFSRRSPGQVDSSGIRAQDHGSVGRRIRHIWKPRTKGDQALKLFSRYTSVIEINQGRKWLPKTGWASSTAARRRCPAAFSILPKTGWAIGQPPSDESEPS